eukprot:2589015-Amphidinium_carterae.1
MEWYSCFGQLLTFVACIRSDCCSSLIAFAQTSRKPQEKVMASAGGLKRNSRADNTCRVVGSVRSASSRLIPECCKLTATSFQPRILLFSLCCEVIRFTHTVIRLFCLLHAMALEEIAELKASLH